jgi:hypothetical protein
MAIRSIPCPVLGAHITQVTDLEGAITRIICPEYDELNGTCRVKKSISDGGPLSRLVERVREDALNTRTQCIFRP